MKLGRAMLALAAWGMTRVGACVLLVALSALLVPYAIAASGEVVSTVSKVLLGGEAREVLARAGLDLGESLLRTHLAHKPLLIYRARGVLYSLNNSSGWWMSRALGATLACAFGFALRARLRPRPNMPACF
jgi:hypothetical protein